MYLGRGTYGTVVKENNVAVKTYHKLPHLIQEYVALRYLDDCKYIVHAKDVLYDKNQLVMDLYDMSLNKWLKSECSCNDCLQHIVHNILCGIIELHDRGLAHCDIKPS